MRNGSIVVLVGLVLAAWGIGCSGNPPDEEFERTKKAVQKADEELHEALRDLEIGRGTGMACPKAQKHASNVQRHRDYICAASQRYPDYAPFTAKCNSVTEESRSAPKTSEAICSGAPDDGDDDY